MGKNKFWMITDVSQLQCQDFGRIVSIPTHRAPKRLQPDRETAEKELLRLQDRHPDSEFVLLEAVAVAKPKTMLIIKPITSFMAIDNIDSDPEIPF
jgi:hypothetical protein